MSTLSPYAAICAGGITLVSCALMAARRRAIAADPSDSALSAGTGDGDSAAGLNPTGPSAAQLAGLSRRGRVGNKPFLSYLAELLQGFASPYDKHTNPGGFLQCTVAENRNMWELLEAKLATCRGLTQHATGYDNPAGSVRMRAAAAAMLTHTGVVRSGINPDDLVITAGVSAGLSNVAVAVCDPGDVVLVTAPCYAAFPSDITGRSESVLEYVQLQHPKYEYTEEILEAAYARATARGKHVRMLLLTNPENPVAVVHTRAEVRVVIDWCLRRRVHALFDEIYANSVFDKEAAGGEGFTSAADLVAVHYADNPDAATYVHSLWGMSKDFGISGFHIGFMHTRNPALMRAMHFLAVGTGLCSDTDLQMSRALEDLPWVDGYLEAAHKVLRDGRDAVTSQLAAAGVPFTPAPSGMFVWIDCRPFLPQPPTYAAERALFKALFAQAKVIVTPGESQHAPPGFVRICTAWHPADAVKLAGERFVRVLLELRSAYGKGDS